jgi:hypothetical protein
MTAQTLTTTSVAKIIRHALQAKFTGTKFSVRSSRYAGGSSIDVRWSDGPTWREVQNITCHYSGSAFDGSIDMKHYRDHWLLSDNTAIIAHDEGTENSRGSHPPIDNPKPHPSAALVHFQCDGVHCERTVTAAGKEAFRAMWDTLTDMGRLERIRETEAWHAAMHNLPNGGWSGAADLADFGSSAPDVLNVLVRNTSLPAATV